MPHQSPFVFLFDKWRIQVLLLAATYYAQTLALRRNMHIHQSLTSTHDNSEAWFGLAQAFLTVRRQFSFTKKEKQAGRKGILKANVWQILSVILIFVHAVGVYILGITMPVLLNIDYAPVKGFKNITNVLPNVGGNVDM